MRELAADGEAETRSAIFPAGACVRLLEGLEDDFLLFLRYADAGIRYLESRHHRRLAEHGVFRVPSLVGGRHLEPNAALLRELEGIEQKILSTCCTRLESVVMLRPRFGSI